MIPILYDKDETAFVSNGLCRLRDAISVIVTEERNSIYELDMEYPVTGANYDLIQIGRIIGATHDDSGDVQPFDIVSATRPIDGVVTFHAVHISYRQSYITVPGGDYHPVATDISSSFSILRSTGVPSNPFTYWTDITASGGIQALISGVPYSVRQLLGGVEGSILDTYGGEYEWDKWTVKLWSARGQYRDFSIRYGVNMLEYEDQMDSSDTYSSCVPYWTDGTDLVVASKIDSGASTVTGRGECIPLDLSEKFESKPTKTQLRNKAKSYMNSNNTYSATQTISVSFARLQDMGEYAAYQDLLRCGLCDTINVIFPDYKTQAPFKIVKTVWNVLTGKYDGMELGDLSISLSEALGITNTGERIITVPTKTSDLTNDSGFITASDRLTSFWKIVEKEVTVDAINAHSNQSAASYSFTVPDGFNAVAIGGWSSDNYRIRPTTHYISSSLGTLYAGFANTSATNVSAGVKVNFRILCIHAGISS